MSVAKPGKVFFSKRPKSLPLPHGLGKRKVWLSDCGNYRVERLYATLDQVDRFLAMRRDMVNGRPTDLFSIISSHRKFAPAVKACRDWDRLRAGGGYPEKLYADPPTSPKKRTKIVRSSTNSGSRPAESKTSAKRVLRLVRTADGKLRVLSNKQEKP